MKFGFRCWTLLSVLTLTAMVQAAPPFSLLPFRRVEADQRKAYHLTEGEGPWLIMCASFAGSKAETQARELVMELRKEHSLEAYIHRRNYDFTKPVKGLGLDRYGNVRRMRNSKATRFNEIAVLVGNFDSIDQSKAQKTLKKVKYLHPDCLDIKKRASYQRFAMFRYIQRAINGDEDVKTKGPMGKAFFTRNPALPQAFFTQSQVDDLIYDMNKNVEFSLLKNKGNFTVQVASFRGNVRINVERGFNPNEPVSNKLEQAAMKAHKMTTALRKRGVEAYEYHDRHQSIVTIGSFADLGQQRLDGRIEFHPSIARIIASYGAQQSMLPGGRQTSMQPRMIEGIPFEIQPKPVHVPKRSIASRINQR